MLESEMKLVDNVKILKKKGWIPSVQKGYSSVRITFDKAIGKMSDRFSITDYDKYEIKCVMRSSGAPMYLFSSCFEGNARAELNRLVDNYGWRNKVGVTEKTLFFRGNCCYKYSPNKTGYKFKFKLDYRNQKIRLQVFNFKNVLIDNKAFIYFDSLEKCFNDKLRKIALVWANRKSIFGKEYYNYYRVCFYKNKGFDNFIDLLGKGMIDIGIYGRIVETEEHRVEFKFKNLDFRISREHLDRLFACYYDSLENI